MIRVETQIELGPQPAAVFARLADLERFPAWNSAVQRVVPRLAGPPVAGSRYAMSRRLPQGHVDDDLEVATIDAPRELVLRTIGGPTPFVYRYTLSARDEGGTLLQLVAEIELGPIAELVVGPWARRAVREGIDDNLRTFRAILDDA
jgi:carbon monoxide dehydrogenase subunit G